MGKDFKCEACHKDVGALHMRDSDGRWVYAHCIPGAELYACPGLRERLGLPAKRAAQSRRKAA